MSIYALTSLKLNGSPFLALNPFGLDAVISLVDGDSHFVAAINNFEATIGHVGRINTEEDGEVLHILDLRVSDSVNMRSKTT